LLVIGQFLFTWLRRTSTEVKMN